jgi:hypothetical protein
VIGKLLVPRQPSVALALLRRGLLRRALVPDFASAVVCERWVLDVGAETQRVVVEQRASGGCPNGDVWLSEVERDGAAGAGGRRDAGGGGGGEAMSAFDVADAKLTAPRLFLVIVDAYQFGVGGDCTSCRRAERRQRRDAVRAVHCRQVPESRLC